MRTVRFCNLVFATDVVGSCSLHVTAGKLDEHQVFDPENIVTLKSYKKGPNTVKQTKEKQNKTKNES